MLPRSGVVLVSNSRCGFTRDRFVVTNWLHRRSWQPEKTSEANEQHHPYGDDCQQGGKTYSKHMAPQRFVIGLEMMIEF